ncbi:MAG: sigma-70 family RNA polymerase sigma factor [Oscillospiraceae bacterium]|nr:sigma-70 family RNA polymerase sigma factor [Oscillospiraceae bacterium]
MTDARIIELYFERDERAISETDRKYGPYCRSIAYNILFSKEDSEECVNDTYLRAWTSMPPQRPNILSAFLAKICRGLSIDRWRRDRAEKRGGGETALALDELEYCIPAGSGDPADELELRELQKLYARFISSLSTTERRVFLCRYWYMDSIKSIAHRFGFTEAKVTSMLHRTRERFRAVLEKEGYR